MHMKFGLASSVLQDFILHLMTTARVYSKTDWEERNTWWRKHLVLHLPICSLQTNALLSSCLTWNVGFELQVAWNPLRTTHFAACFVNNVPGRLFVLTTLKAVPTVNFAWIQADKLVKFIFVDNIHWTCITTCLVLSKPLIYTVLSSQKLGWFTYHCQFTDGLTEIKKYSND